MDDCLIVGGGVIGLSLAYELSGHQLRVRVIDRGRMGTEASWAGAGILPPTNLQTAIHPLDRLRAMSHQLHSLWAEALREETGIDTGYRRCGGIYLARGIGEMAALAGLASFFVEQKIAIEKLTPETIADLEPALKPLVDSGRLKAAYLLPDEAQLRNPDHLAALQQACRQRGVQFTEGAEVKGFETGGGRLRSVTTDVAKFSAEWYCLTTGAWTHRLLTQLGIEVGILPVRGQIVLYRCARPLFTRVLNEGSRYMVPRDDGRVLVGSTEEEAGFVKETTEAGLAELQTMARQLVPELERAEVERCWSGLRPGSYDGFPYLGIVPGMENALVAAGHFRSGLHMSPGTAVILSQLIRGEEPQLDLTPFSVGRG